MMWAAVSQPAAPSPTITTVLKQSIHFHLVGADEASDLALISIAFWGKLAACLKDRDVMPNLCFARRRMRAVFSAGHLNQVCYLGGLTELL
jgi:hypothetical protein